LEQCTIIDACDLGFSIPRDRVSIALSNPGKAANKIITSPFLSKKIHMSNTSYKILNFSLFFLSFYFFIFEKYPSFSTRHFSYHGESAGNTPKSIQEGSISKLHDLWALIAGRIYHAFI
jgi:hypothetical protein